MAESTYKSVKVELVYQHHFDTQNQLDRELFQDVYWWNHYRTPIEYRELRTENAIGIK